MVQHVIFFRLKYAYLLNMVKCRVSMLKNILSVCRDIEDLKKQRKSNRF